MVPLRGRTELVGALLVDGRTEDLLLNQRRLNILNGIASQASTSIESVRLLADLAMRQVLEHELDLAREIQKSFLPDCCPAGARLSTGLGVAFGAARGRRLLRLHAVGQWQRGHRHRRCGRQGRARRVVHGVEPHAGARHLDERAHALRRFAPHQHA